MKTIAIRVSDDDHKLFSSLAAREDMPLSVLVRRQLRALAREHALLVDAPIDQQDESTEPSTPRVTWRPIPQGTNVWAYEVHARRKAGESFADIAESYGADVDTVKRKFKFAEEQIDAGHLTPMRQQTPELVYAPVDPDNPTEAEQRANADIARQKLLDMGLL